jgi:hypothetical protein
MEEKNATTPNQLVINDPEQNGLDQLTSTEEIQGRQRHGWTRSPNLTF